MTQPAASFRDPAGSCCQVDGRIFRLLDAVSATGYEVFLESASACAFAERGKLVSTRRLAEDEMVALRHLPQLQAALARLGTRYAGAGVPTVFFEHERIWFPSYPYEWPPEMLWAAAELTLELARASLADGYGLKDATPYNVLFRGTEPVFIDVSSFRPRAAGDPMWRPYGQFVRTFLLPLLVNQH